MNVGLETKSYVGVDLGKLKMVCTRITNDDEVERFNFETGHKGEKSFIEKLNPDDIVVIEAGNQSFRIARKIREHGNEVIILNSKQLAIIYMSKKKTDPIDSRKLAQFARNTPRSELPEVYVPNEEEEDARRLLTELSFWANINTKLKNRLHSLFVQAGITHVKKNNITNKNSRDDCVELLPPNFKKEAKRLIGQLKSNEKQLNIIDMEIIKVLKANLEYTKIAMSVPGIGPKTTLAFLAYLGDCERFETGKQIGNFLGLVPWVYRSSGRVKHGRTIRGGCIPIKRLIIPCAWALVKSKNGGELQKFYNRTSKRIGKKKAFVALARKIAVVFSTLIKKGELYNGTPIDVLEEKLKRNGLL